MYVLKEVGILAFNYIVKTLRLLDTIRLNLPQTFGNMRQGQQLLPYVLMTSALNHIVKTTKTIF